jgi:hypothetical protein
MTPACMYRDGCPDSYACEASGFCLQLRSLQGECPSGTTSKSGLQQARKPDESPALSSKKQGLVADVAAVITKFREYIERRHNANIGYHNDPYAWETMNWLREAEHRARAAIEGLCAETNPPRSVEGLTHRAHRTLDVMPVRPVLGTPEQLTDDELKRAIGWETEASTYRALVELWERRGAQKTNPKPVDEIAGDRDTSWDKP